MVVSLNSRLESNKEEEEDVRFRFMFIKCAKGDAPGRDTLFNGESDNTMLDAVNNSSV